jgi:hypothetical protein
LCGLRRIEWDTPSPRNCRAVTAALSCHASLSSGRLPPPPFPTRFPVSSWATSLLSTGHSEPVAFGPGGGFASRGPSLSQPLRTRRPILFLASPGGIPGRALSRRWGLPRPLGTNGHRRATRDRNPVRGGQPESRPRGPSFGLWSLVSVLWLATPLPNRRPCRRAEPPEPDPLGIRTSPRSRAGASEIGRPFTLTGWAWRGTLKCRCTGSGVKGHEDLDFRGATFVASLHSSVRKGVACRGG